MKQNLIKRRIVFYRIGAIGDIIHTLPLIREVKKLNPNASIELIIGSGQLVKLLNEAADYIDRIWLISHNGPFNKPLKVFQSKSITAEEKELFASIKQFPVDEFVYLHSNSLKAFLIGKFLLRAAKLFVYKNQAELAAVENYALSYLDNAAVLDFKNLELPRTNDSKYICVVLGVGKQRPSRAYPLIKWIQFIEDILAKTDLDIYLLGGPDEESLSIEFGQAIELRKAHLNLDPKSYARINNLIGKTDLYKLAQIVNNAIKIYSADTGILHIAAALDVPIESIFTITSSKRYGPFNPHAEVHRSKHCLCHNNDSQIKHCKNMVAGYARCSWGIQL